MYWIAGLPSVQRYLDLNRIKLGVLSCLVHTDTWWLRCERIANLEIELGCAVLGTRMIAQIAGEEMKYTGLIQGLICIFNEDGFRGLFR